MAGFIRHSSFCCWSSTKNILILISVSFNHCLTIWKHLRFFLIMMKTTMTATMTATKTTTTIMIVVVLSFLGLAPSGILLLSETKILKMKLVQVSKSNTIFLAKTKTKYKWIKSIIHNLMFNINPEQKLKTIKKLKPE